MPAVAATALHLAATVQVSCPAGAAAVWKLLPAVEKVLPFSFESGVSLAEWANLLGAVREPDFQASYQSGLRLAPRPAALPHPHPHPDCPIWLFGHQPTHAPGRTGCLLRLAESSAGSLAPADRGAPAGRRLPAAAAEI